MLHDEDPSLLKESAISATHNRKGDEQFFLSEVLNNIQLMNREDKELRKIVVAVAEMYTIYTTRISIYTVWVRVVRCQFSPLPTRSIGASGQWCLTSGFHFVVTFS